MDYDLYYAIYITRRVIELTNSDSKVVKVMDKSLCMNCPKMYSIIKKEEIKEIKILKDRRIEQGVYVKK